MIDRIPHEDLRVEHVPDLGAPWPVIFKFALTFNGYEALGGNRPCGDLANRTEAHFVTNDALPDTLNLTELRSCLFFEQRRWRHFGETPHGEAIRYFGALLEAIREHVR